MVSNRRFTNGGKTFLWIWVLLFGTAGTLTAQRAQPHEHHFVDPEGHDTHQHQGHDHLAHIEHHRREVPFLANLPEPKRLEGIGEEEFPIATASGLTQQWFNQGVALLHCFWDFEAYRAFKEAIRHDSTAIMPYWGLLSAIGAIEGDEFGHDRLLALRRLKGLLHHANEHERLYAEAIVARNEDRVAGRKTYQQKLETVLHKYPDDIQAKLFLAMSVRSGHDLDLNPRDGTVYAEFLLRDVLRSHPDNAAAHHYWIHLKENCCPEQALESARILPKLAPASGHMLHMPGHVYYKLGRYDDAQRSFLEAVRADSAYMADQGIPEVDTWNYIHNINYLLSNAAESGKYGIALYYAERLEDMPATPERKRKYDGRFFYQGKIAPAKMELCFGKYDRAVERLRAITNTDSIYPRRAIAYRDALLLFAEGLAALARQDLEEARRYSEGLDASLWRNGQGPAQDKIGGRWLPSLEVASVELRGRVLAAVGDYDGALALLELANRKEAQLGYSEPPTYARPVLISLGETYLAAGNFEKAEDAYRQLLVRHPGTANGLWGLYKVYKAQGNADQARIYQAKLQQAVLGGDASLFPW